MELNFLIIQAISKSPELMFTGNAAPINLKVISVRWDLCWNMNRVPWWTLLLGHVEVTSVYNEER